MMLDPNRLWIRIRGTVSVKKQSRFVALVLATHFPQALAMVVLTVSASWIYGQQGIGIIFVLIAIAAGQASIGWVNDYIDYEIDNSLNRADKPLVRNTLLQKQLKTPIIISLLVTVLSSLVAGGWIGGLAHIFAVASAQLYNIHLARTIWSWLPYAVSFGLLTVFVTQTSDSELWPSWQVVVIAICVGVIAHVFNAVPDLQIDRKSNLGGLVVSLGKMRSLVIAGALSVVIVWLVLDLWLTR